MPTDVELIEKLRPLAAYFTGRRQPKDRKVAFIRFFFEQSGIKRASVDYAMEFFRTNAQVLGVEEVYDPVLSGIAEGKGFDKIMKENR